MTPDDARASALGSADEGVAAAHPGAPGADVAPAADPGASDAGSGAPKSDGGASKSDGGAPDAGGPAVSVGPGPGAESIICSMRVPQRASSVRHVRREIVADLSERGFPEELVEEAEIVVSELLTNAIRHARALSDGTVRVRWKIRAEVVEVEVTDGGGATVPRPAPRTVWLDSGRGLRIVRSMAHEWGVTEDRTGNVVWATLGGPSRRRAN
ncbi:MAG: ATP-binding protein [Dermatophilaceae bacterium]